MTFHYLLSFSVIIPRAWLIFKVLPFLILLIRHYENYLNLPALTSPMRIPLVYFPRSLWIRMMCIWEPPGSSRAKVHFSYNSDFYSVHYMPSNFSASTPRLPIPWRCKLTGSAVPYENHGWVPWVKKRLSLYFSTQAALWNLLCLGSGASALGCGLGEV